MERNREIATPGRHSEPRNVEAATAPRTRERRRAGFTLIEIMAVVLIMGLLMGLVGVSVFSQVDKAKVITTRAKISQLENALEFYRMDNSRYPTSDEGLGALLDAPPDARNYPPGGYLQKSVALKDPWDEPFQYASPGEHNQNTFDIWSFGADSAAGGSDLDSDIGNWDDDGQG